MNTLMLGEAPAAPGQRGAFTGDTPAAAAYTELLRGAWARKQVTARNVLSEPTPKDPMGGNTFPMDEAVSALLEMEARGELAYGRIVLLGNRVAGAFARSFGHSVYPRWSEWTAGRRVAATFHPQKYHWTPAEQKSALRASFDALADW